MPAAGDEGYPDEGRRSASIVGARWQHFPGAAGAADVCGAGASGRGAGTRMCRA